MAPRQRPVPGPQATTVDIVIHVGFYAAGEHSIRWSRPLRPLFLALFSDFRQVRPRRKWARPGMRTGGSRTRACRAAAEPGASAPLHPRPAPLPLPKHTHPCALAPTAATGTSLHPLSLVLPAVQVRNGFRCVRRTLPGVFNVIVLLLMVIALFALLLYALFRDK